MMTGNVDPFAAGGTDIEGVLPWRGVGGRWKEG